MRVVLAVIVIVAAFAGSTALAVVLSVNSINESNHNWCAALEILTQHVVPAPADPKANPSRETSFLLYQSLKGLEARFRC